MSGIREQIDAVKAAYEALPEGLGLHIQRVLVESLDLAERWDLDPERVELATWGHDLYRSRGDEEWLRLAMEMGIPLRHADELSPVLLHGPIAARALYHDFGVRDDEVLMAVHEHTLGSPDISQIGAVVLLADKFEERKRKRTPIMKDIRRVARRDLDTALIAWADWRWTEDAERGWLVHPDHWWSRITWIARHHAEIGLPPILPETDPAFDDETVTTIEFLG